jgi:hypothetical protein
MNMFDRVVLTNLIIIALICLFAFFIHGCATLEGSSICGYELDKI